MAITYNIKKDFDYQEKYIEFLKDNGYTDGTIQKYISSIKIVFEKYFNHPIVKNDHNILSLIDYRSRTLLVEIILGNLQNERIRLKREGKGYKTIQNHYSAVMTLSAYLGESETEWDGIDILSTMMITPINNKYSYREVLSVFTLRINTQDRYYDNCCFPCRLFNKIFKGEKRYDDLIKKMLNDTVFCLDKGQEEEFKNIKEIAFTNNNIVVTTNKGKVSELYTEVYKKGKSAGFERINNALLKDLSLDHKMPLVDLLKKKINSYVELKKISDNLLIYKNKTKLSGSKLCTIFYETILNTLLVNKDVLFNELQDFFSEISLIIMLKKYNSSKNKN